MQNSGVTELVSAASTIPTTASGSFFELEPFADESWFHGGALDSTSARSNSYRRHQQIPDPNALYKLRMRWKNGAIAPASNTNAVIQYVALQDYAELTAEITAGRGQSVAGQALGVQIALGLGDGVGVLHAGGQDVRPDPLVDRSHHAGSRLGEHAAHGLHQLGQQLGIQFEAGAQLVQLYSGLIYAGPALIKDCARALRGKQAK